MAGHHARPVGEANHQVIPRFKCVSHERPLEGGLDATLKPPTRTQAPVPPPGLCLSEKWTRSPTHGHGWPPWARDSRAHLDAAVVHARRLAPDAARVTAPGAALHLHARRPDQEVGGRGVHLAPRYLVDDSPGLAGRRDGLLCRDERRVNVLETPGLWQLPGVQAGVTHGPRLLPTGHVTQTPVQHRQKDPSPQLRAADWPKDEQ